MSRAGASHIQQGRAAAALPGREGLSAHAGVEHDGTGWTAVEGSGARGAGCSFPGNVLGVVMFDQVPPASADDPIVLRPSAAAAWVWVVLAAFFAFALIRGYLGAGTTGGRIGVVIFMGACVALAGWAAVYMVTHRSTMSISASEITWAKAATTRTRAAGPEVLVLDRSAGQDLRLVTASRGNRTYANGLTIAGTGTTLPIRTFDPNQVRKACRAKGWQFPP